MASSPDLRRRGGQTGRDEEIAAILGDLESAPLGLGEDPDFRISIAGAQEKTALLFWKGRWHKRGRRRRPRTSSSLRSDDCRTASTCLQCRERISLPRADGRAGLSSANVAIEEFEGHRVLVVERFDRAGPRTNVSCACRRRIAARRCRPAVAKYESDRGPGMAAILDLLKGSDQPEIDQRRFSRP